MAKKNTYRLLSILLLLSICLQGRCFAQQQHSFTEYLQNGDTAEVLLCQPNDVVTFNRIPYYFDDHSAYDAWAIVQSNSALNIYTTNQLNVIYTGNGYITIRDGNNVLIDSTSNYSNNVIQNCSPPVLIHIHIDSNVFPGNAKVEVRENTNTLNCESNIQNITLDNLGGDSVDVVFQTLEDTVLVSLDDGPWMPVATPMFYGHTVLHDLPCGSHSITLTTLADSGSHCCRYTKTFFSEACPPTSNCFEATDLHAKHVTCTYGNIFETEENYGAVDKGNYSSNGRHTVMRDTAFYDPMISSNPPLLRTVCEGCDSTVRLGNSGVGAEWEAVNYAITIDTLVNAILILKYAAVLQNPNHSAYDQPRFAFDLFDQDMQPAGNTCAHADFAASSSLGWNSYNDFVWKDWTTVGFDLTEYHGQTLNLRFRTNDCLMGAHFGYAYFTTQCSTRNIKALHCGVVDSNTFSAPGGFLYEWVDSAGHLVSTERTITLPSDGKVYLCHLTSKEDSACTFTLGIYAGTRLPKAAGKVEQIRTDDCQTYEVSFQNGDFITADGVTQVPYGYRCDEVTWYFGDGDSAMGINPTHTYHAPGTYTVVIKASLNDDECTDTAHLTVELPTFFDKEEVLNACNSLRWRDGVLYTNDTIGPTFLETSPAHCDTLYILNLNIHNTPEVGIKLLPEKLTYENLTLHAYDITEGEHSRTWSIVHADGDSLHLPDTATHLVYTADVGDDSTRVVLAVDNGVCLDTATGCIYLVRADFFAPNVFTPGLPDNNRFVIPCIGIHQLSLTIFSRTGLLVFSTDHPEEGWDGTRKGVPCMQGAYVWHLTYTSDITPERIQTAVGTVTLVR